MIIRFFDILGIWGIAIWIFTHNIREGNSYNYKLFASDGIWTQDLLNYSFQPIFQCHKKMLIFPTVHCVCKVSLRVQCTIVIDLIISANVSHENPPSLMGSLMQFPS